MREEHGLRALRSVGPRRDDDRAVEELLRAVEQRAAQRAEPRGAPRSLSSVQSAQVERDLVVAGAAGVDAAAGVAGELDQAPLDVQMDVLVGVVETEAAGRDLPSRSVWSAFSIRGEGGAARGAPRAGGPARARAMPAMSSAARRRSNGCESGEPARAPRPGAVA